MPSPRRPERALSALAALLLAASVALLAPAPALASASARRGLHVAGNRLLDRHGRRLMLRGVNRSGTEYACIQGWGIFDGPSSAASVRAMAAWHMNFVRVLVNEDCWLGINGVKPAYGGAAYRRAIKRYVTLLNRHGMYVEVSLIWAAPGSYQATYQPGAPDEDHAPEVWAGMAAAFRHDPGVILAPWGETIVDGRCFLHGGVCEATYGPANRPYRTAGMQQAVDVMRAAGYRGVISIPGVDYANDLSGWLRYEPRDPLHQLIAEAHIYGGNTCSSVSCFDRTLAPVARRVPLIFGETGESYDASSCGAANTRTFLGWADAHHVGYAAWTWDTWGSCEALIRTYGGIPDHAYGRFVKAWYAQHARGTYRFGG
ncbi:MAG TPA: cellulase family glycosylhydrolase [Solirubrobacteraceae bacterium]|nr:cellulase family glycosylhydrolase [Solirubrobacteraceae bacterium]